MSASRYRFATVLLILQLVGSLILLVRQPSAALARTEPKHINGLNSKQRDFYKRSIVFDIKTPKVFYCPQEKQTNLEQMIVQAKPLDKLCEFEGKSKPNSSPSDCYNDVDETKFACEEKRRFMLRLISMSSESDEQGYSTALPAQDFSEANDYTTSKDSHPTITKTKKKASINQ